MYKINYFFMGEVTQVKSLIALTDCAKERYAKIATAMSRETGATPIVCIHALFKAMNDEAKRIEQEFLHGQSTYDVVNGIISAEAENES